MTVAAFVECCELSRALGSRAPRNEDDGSKVKLGNSAEQDHAWNRARYRARIFSGRAGRV